MFPQAYLSVLQQVEQALCQQAILTQVNSVVQADESRAMGVTNLIVACLQLLDNSEVQYDVASSDSSVSFNFALGNILACDKIANTVLSLPLKFGDSSLCDAITPPQ